LRLEVVHVFGAAERQDRIQSEAGRKSRLGHDAVGAFRERGYETSSFSSSRARLNDRPDIRSIWARNETRIPAAISAAPDGR